MAIYRILKVRFITDEYYFTFGFRYVINIAEEKFHYCCFDHSQLWLNIGWMECRDEDFGFDNDFYRFSYFIAEFTIITAAAISLLLNSFRRDWHLMFFIFNLSYCKWHHFSDDCIYHLWIVSEWLMNSSHAY